MKKSVTIFSITLILILCSWELSSQLEIVPSFMLPSFTRVVGAIIEDFPLLLMHMQTTLYEALVGLIISILLSIILAFAMDASKLVKQILYPLLIVSQTIPTVAIAPLLVLWFGYDVAPKIILIVIVCFFPLTMHLFTGLQSIDVDLIHLFKTFKATKIQTIRFLKWPSILPNFFNGLKVATSYAVVGAVIAEWLGGNSGLGVYMTRVRKSFAFDKMFGVIMMTSIFSLILVGIIFLLEKHVLQYKSTKER